MVGLIANKKFDLLAPNVRNTSRAVTACDPEVKFRSLPSNSRGANKSSQHRSTIPIPDGLASAEIERNNPRFYRGSSFTGDLKIDCFTGRAIVYLCTTDKIDCHLGFITLIFSTVDLPYQAGGFGAPAKLFLLITARDTLYPVSHCHPSRSTKQIGFLRSIEFVIRKLSEHLSSTNDKPLTREPGHETRESYLNTQVDDEKVRVTRWDFSPGAETDGIRTSDGLCCRFINGRNAFR